MNFHLNRRAMLMGSAVAAAATMPSARAACHDKANGSDFLWGAAGAAYQVEGNNIGSDIWVLEHLKPTMFKEISGDAADSYHRYADDIALAASLGLNTYRFSIEWSRIEPEPGQISHAAIAYYRRLLETIRRHGMTPFVTYNHFTIPIWFAASGGFTHIDGIAAFVRFSTLITERLGDLFDYTVTFNEPNLWAQLAWSPGYPRLRAAFDAASAAAATSIGRQQFASPTLSNWTVQQPIMIEAHLRAYDAIKTASKGRMAVGFTLSLPDERDPDHGPSGRERKLGDYVYPWLDAQHDFVGVQNYTYNLVGPDSDLPPPSGVELTQMGYPLAPETLGNVLRMVASRTKKPLFVTEHGCAVDDDSRRIHMIDHGLKGLYDCLRDGIDIRGYIHWSLLDNYEWFYGYAPKFGLVAVDRTTFQRTPKGSAYHLGKIARQGLPHDLKNCRP